MAFRRLERKSRLEPKRQEFVFERRPAKSTKPAVTSKRRRPKLK